MKSCSCVPKRSARSRCSEPSAKFTPAGHPVARTYRVKVALPDDTPLRVGMSVEAEYRGHAREGRRVPPVPPVAAVGGEVFVVDGARAYRRKVEVGLRGTRATEIVSGLEGRPDRAGPGAAGTCRRRAGERHGRGREMNFSFSMSPGLHVRTRAREC